MSEAGRRIEIRGTVQGVGFRPWIYRLAYEIRSLIVEPPRPRAGGGSLPPHHPYQRIVRLIEGRSDLSWFVGA